MTDEMKEMADEAAEAGRTFTERVSVTGGDLIETVQSLLREATVRKIEISAQGKHLAEVDRERLLAKYAAIDARSTLQEAYVGLPRGKEDGDFGNRNVTRLGPESLVVVPVHTDDGAWRLHAGDPGFDPGAPPDPVSYTHLTLPTNREV